MKKSILLYSIAVAAGAFLLKWLEYHYAVRVFSTEIYVVSIALLFAGLGVWVGLRIAAPAPAPAGKRPFAQNVQATEYLGISKREYEVLQLLAQGHSNREIAEKLCVSANTVKSHLARLYEKLEVSRRTQAIRRAQALRLIP